MRSAVSRASSMPPFSGVSTNSRAERRHGLAPLDGQVLGHHQHHAVAAHRRDHGERDAGVAAGGLDQRVAGLDRRRGARRPRSSRAPDGPSPSRRGCCPRAWRAATLVVSPGMRCSRTSGVLPTKCSRVGFICPSMKSPALGGASRCGSEAILTSSSCRRPSSRHRRPSCRHRLSSAFLSSAAFARPRPSSRRRRPSCPRPSSRRRPSCRPWLSSRRLRLSWRRQPSCPRLSSRRRRLSLVCVGLRRRRPSSRRRRSWPASSPRSALACPAFLSSAAVFLSSAFGVGSRLRVGFLRLRPSAQQRQVSRRLSSLRPSERQQASRRPSSRRPSERQQASRRLSSLRPSARQRRASRRLLLFGLRRSRLASPRRPSASALSLSAFETSVVPESWMSPLILSKVASPMPSTFFTSSSDLNGPFLVR